MICEPNVIPGSCLYALIRSKGLSFDICSQCRDWSCCVVPEDPSLCCRVDRFGAKIYPLQSSAFGSLDV
jgi:hypothetical protein